MLQGQLGEGMIEQLAGQIGADKDQTATAANGVFLLCLAASIKCCRSPGAQSFCLPSSAITMAAFWTILRDLIMGNASAPNTSTNGAGILNHVLGTTRRHRRCYCKMSGLDSGKVTQLLITLAPMVLACWAKCNNQSRRRWWSLLDLIARPFGVAPNNSHPAISLRRLLDRDGDGSMMDDLLQMEPSLCWVDCLRNKFIFYIEKGLAAMSGFFVHRHIGNHYPAKLFDLTTFFANGFYLYAMPLMTTIVVNGNFFENKGTSCLYQN